MKITCMFPRHACAPQPMLLSTKSCDFPLNLHMSTKNDKVMRCQDHDSYVSFNMFHDLSSKRNAQIIKTSHPDPSAPLVANLHHYPGTRIEIIRENFMGYRHFHGYPESLKKTNSKWGTFWKFLQCLCLNQLLHPGNPWGEPRTQDPAFPSGRSKVRPSRRHAKLHHLRE